MEKASLGAATRLRGVGKAMGVAGAGLAAGARLLRRAALPLAVIGGAAVKVASDFQQAMEMVHTQAGETQKNVDKLSGSVLKLAKVRPQGPVQLANALYRLEGAGIRGQHAMDALSAASNLAAVGNANVEDTAKTLAQTWFSGIAGAKNFNSVVAELNATVGAGDLRLQQLVDALGVGILPVAKTVGLHFRDITGVMALFGDETNNVSGWTAQLATALHYLYAPTAKSEKALNSIGLSGRKLGEDFRKKNGLLTAMKDLRAHLDKLPGGFRGVRAGEVRSDILPGGRGRVLTVLLSQLDRYQQKLKQVGGTTGKWGDAIAKTHETAAFKIHTAWSSIQATGVQLGSVLLPVVAPAFSAVAKAIDSVVTSGINLGRKGGAIQQFFSGLGGGPKAPPPPPRVLGQGNAPRDAQQLSGMQRAGLAVRNALSPVVSWVQKNWPKVGKALGTAGKQLLDAFKPAMPFIKNVVLPLLKGIGEGVLLAVVGSFKILVPIIRVFAGVLGFVGKTLAPFKKIIEGIGVVIGVAFSGDILAALGSLGKLGVVFRALAIPVRIVNGVFRVAFGVVAKLVGWWVRAHLALLRFVGSFVSAPARLARAALNIVGGVIHIVESLPGKLLSIATKAGGKIASGLTSGVRSRLTSIAAFFGRVGKAIVDAIVSAIKAAPGAITGAISSIIPGGVKKVLKKAGGLVGGITSHLATGGLVRQGGWAVVGERGPELAHFPNGAQVYDANQTRRARTGQLSGGGIINLTANLHLSGKQIHQEVFRVDMRQREAM